MKFTLSLVCGLGLIYALLILVLYAGQRRFLYFPPSDYLSPKAVEVVMEEIDMSWGEGLSLRAWWSPSQKGQAVIMFFHGNASAVYSHHDIYKDLTAAGFGVWAAAYPGYPGSEGTAKQSAIMMATKHQYAYILENIPKTTPVYFYGTSLGSGVAAQLARTHPPHGLIAEAPFASILNMGRRQLPFVPHQILMKDQWRSDQALEDMAASGKNIPLLWLHGTEDKVVPLDEGERLFLAYAGPKQSYIIKGGAHTNLWGLGGREAIIEFINATTRPQ